MSGYHRSLRYPAPRTARVPRSGVQPIPRAQRAATAPVGARARVQTVIACEVCGKQAAPARHPCRFAECCSCWRARPCSSQRGQALVEFALVMPIVLALFLGAADLGTAGLELAVLQNSAQTVAALTAQGLPADDQRVQDELLRCGCTLVYAMDDAPRVVVELSRHHVSLTSALPDTLTATASAVAQEGTP